MPNIKAAAWQLLIITTDGTHNPLDVALHLQLKWSWVKWAQGHFSFIQLLLVATIPPVFAIEMSRCPKCAARRHEGQA